MLNRKITTNYLILPSYEDQILLSKAFTDVPTGSLCMIVIPASCLQTCFAEFFFRELSLSRVSKQFVFASSVVRTIWWTDHAPCICKKLYKTIHFS